MLQKLSLFLFGLLLTYGSQIPRSLAGGAISTLLAEFEPDELIHAEQMEGTAEEADTWCHVSPPPAPHSFTLTERLIPAGSLPPFAAIAFPNQITTRQFKAGSKENAIRTNIPTDLATAQIAFTLYDPNTQIGSVVSLPLSDVENFTRQSQKVIENMTQSMRTLGSQIGTRASELEPYEFFFRMGANTTQEKDTLILLPRSFITELTRKLKTLSPIVIIKQKHASNIALDLKSGDLLEF